MTYSYDHRASRKTYPDGRLIPTAGDKVYKAVGGFMGTSASLVGIVLSSGRVKVTGGRGNDRTCPCRPHF